VSRRRRAAEQVQLPPEPPASEDARVPVAVFIPKPLPPAEARAAWEKLAAALRRIAARR
jgi:hypothetical protein